MATGKGLRVWRWDGRRVVVVGHSIPLPMYKAKVSSVLSMSMGVIEAVAGAAEQPVPLQSASPLSTFLVFYNDPAT